MTICTGLLFMIAFHFVVCDVVIVTRCIVLDNCVYRIRDMRLRHTDG
jgi:hypothetical protein